MTAAILTLNGVSRPREGEAIDAGWVRDQQPTLTASSLAVGWLLIGGVGGGDLPLDESEREHKAGELFGDSAQKHGWLERHLYLPGDDFSQVWGQPC
jgi:hypothetical protein